MGAVDPDGKKIAVEGRFVKGPDLYYKEISSLNCRIFGLPEVYDEDMRLSDTSVNSVKFTEPEKFIREDLQIIESNLVMHCESTFVSAQGDWIRMQMRRSRTKEGGILGTTTLLPVDFLYGGWLQQLDLEREVLQVPNGEELSRAELSLLNAFLHGIPRKLMANGNNVSVKAIEKRLYRIREKLHHTNCCCYSLHGCVNWHGLMQFVMDRADWFDPTPNYHVHPG